MPWHFSKNLIAKSTQSLTAMETFIFGFLAINSSMLFTPKRGDTAITKRPHDGKTASARSGLFFWNGPTPRTAIDGMIDGLSQTKSTFLLATRLAPFKPLHHPRLTPMGNGYGCPLRPV